MGTDKALVPIADDGPPMLKIVLDRVATIAEDVTIVGGDTERYEEFGVRIVPDRFPGSAALGGIATAVSAARNDHCLVVACDMPFLSQPLLEQMAREPRDYDVLAPTVPGASRQGDRGFVFQTLHAIYSRACLPAIERQLASGNFQVIGFFPDVVVREMPVEAVRRYDPSLWSFFNANTPEALALARSLTSVEEL